MRTSTGTPSRSTRSRNGSDEERTRTGGRPVSPTMTAKSSRPTSVAADVAPRILSAARTSGPSSETPRGGFRIESAYRVPGGRPDASAASDGTAARESGANAKCPGYAAVRSRRTVSVATTVRPIARLSRDETRGVGKDFREARYRHIQSDRPREIVEAILLLPVEIGQEQVVLIVKARGERRHEIGRPGVLAPVERGVVRVCRYHRQRDDGDRGGFARHRRRQTRSPARRRRHDGSR